MVTCNTSLLFSMHKRRHRHILFMTMWASLLFIYYLDCNQFLFSDSKDKRNGQTAQRDYNSH